FLKPALHPAAVALQFGGRRFAHLVDLRLEILEKLVNVLGIDEVKALLDEGDAVSAGPDAFPEGIVALRRVLGGEFLPHLVPLPGVHLHARQRRAGAGSVPAEDGGIGGAGVEAAAVLGEGGGGSRTVVTLEDGDGLTAEGFPEADGAIEAGTGEQVA